MSTTWEMLYSHPKPERVEYARSIVSYLDILGFRELVETRSAGEISRILRILAETVRPDSLFKSENIEFTRFSDTVIRSMPIEKHYPHNFIFELRSLLYAQMAFIPLGIPIRGTVTIGDIVQSWGVVYGPAVVRAYELESKKGGPPRIIIDENALNLVRDDLGKDGLQSELESLTKTDQTTVYLDYLKACERELNVPEQEYTIFLGLHRDFIRKGLEKYAHKPAVFCKYEWLRNYHDSSLRERFGAAFPSTLVV